MTPELLVQPVADAILESAPQTEAERRLPDALMRRLREAGLFSIYTPKKFGGMELPLADALRVVEEVSRLDASTGWTVALGFANTMLTANLPEDSARKVLGNGSVLMSGAPGTAVQARSVESGYRINGQWAFNSGCTNADWNLVAAPIFDGDAPRMTPFGPEMIAALLRPGDAEVVDTWHVTGLRGTGSYDLKANDVFVPSELTAPFFIAGGPPPVHDSPLARLPFSVVTALAQSSPVCLGIARRAIDEFKSFAASKSSQPGPVLASQVQTQVALARAEALLGSAKAYYYSEVAQIWDTAVQRRELSLEQRAKARLAIVTAAENAAAAVDMLHRVAGTSGVFTSSILERCWRDVHTALQHFQVQEGRWETAGRVLFGLEPNSPMV